MPGVPFHLGTAGELTKELLARESHGATLGSIDLLAGGPPCPPFSKSRFYRKDKPRALEDAVGEETINAYLTVLKAVMPRAFILENVAGLAYKVHDSALELILRTAEGLGYKLASKVLNAADYGVPQIRERFFVVGMLDGTFSFPEPTHAKAPGHDLLSMDRRPWTTAGEAIGDLDTEENADDTGHFAGGKYHDLLREIPPGDNYLYFTAKRGHPEPKFEWRSRYWSFLLKLSPDMPSWTIQARRSNNMGPLHWRNRILRIEEVKRIQTFPDDWYLSGTVERQWRQVGNAVPPMLAERLGRAIAAQLTATSVPDAA
jgi:DNA (cytosine-5)-methyltransferase 1